MTENADGPLLATTLEEEAGVDTGFGASILESFGLATNGALVSGALASF